MSFTTKWKGANQLLNAVARSNVSHVSQRTMAVPSSSSFSSSSKQRQEIDNDAVGAASSSSSISAGDVTKSAKADSTSAASAPTGSPKSKASASSSSSKAASPMQFDLQSFPSFLRQPHPILDSYQRYEAPATEDDPYAASVTFFNTTPYFRPPPGSVQASDAGGDDVDSGVYLQSLTPLREKEVNELHRHLLKMRRVVQQTGKGRFARMSSLVVAGNGKGMVGYGEGKDENARRATRKAFHQAVKSMDFVERHDGQTIPAEVTGKWSATTVTLRPRPPGFGLRVPPVIHAIARSAGITDLSASIMGSTNPLNVTKATLALLWGGSAPQGLGDGLGSQMRRADKGRGARTVRDIELARGRRLRDVNAISRDGQ